MVLKQNPSLKIEMQRHTDDIGIPSYNQALSAKGARLVMNYLIQKGIARNRLYPVGYGATRQIVTKRTPVGRGDNRRGATADLCSKDAAVLHLYEMLKSEGDETLI